MFICKKNLLKTVHQEIDFRLHQRLLNPRIKMNKTNVKKYCCNTSNFFFFIMRDITHTINMHLAYTHKFAS